MRVTGELLAGLRVRTRQLCRDVSRIGIGCPLRSLGKGVAVRRGSGAVEARAYCVHGVERTHQPRKLRCGIIHLLLHLTIARHNYKVLRRDENNARWPDFQTRRILTALQLDLSAKRVKVTRLAIDGIQPVVAV